MWPSHKLLRWVWLFGLLFCSAVLGAAKAAEISTIHVTDLPVEARHTLQVIATNGPFPYPRDGTVFANREQRLPLKVRGYYREYTVLTPGERSRGARRIIAGRAGERYYTADHYRSFKQIRE